MNNFFNNLIKIGPGFIIAGILGTGSFTFVVDGGERAIMFDAITGTGVRDKVLGEGIHLRIPKLYEPIKFNVRLSPLDISTKTEARDLQKVSISVRILEKPIEANLKKLYLDQKQNYAKKALTNITHEQIKVVVARYNPEELITQRENVSMEIRQGLVARAREFNIDVRDVSILHVEFSHEFRTAIENKQVSQQMAERAKFIVAKSEQEKKITVIRAEAESESAKLFNEAISKYGNAFLELKKLETAHQIVTNLSKNNNITFLPSDSRGASPNLLYKI
jgi:prohibitin 1